MIKRQSWQEVKKWEEWLEASMTEERKALYRCHAQEDVAQGKSPVVHHLAVTSGSMLGWVSSGSPMPLDGKIPKMDKVTKVKCWYCGGANYIKELKCVHCGAPLLEE